MSRQQQTQQQKQEDSVSIQPYIESFIQNLKPTESLSLSPSSRSRKNLVILDTKIQHFWGNRARRKRIISPYFSESAFGSETDTKEIIVNYWYDEGEEF